MFPIVSRIAPFIVNVQDVIRELRLGRKRKEKSRKKEASGSTHEVTPHLKSSISAILSGGQALPESVRSYYEPQLSSIDNCQKD